VPSGRFLACEEAPVEHVEDAEYPDALVDLVHHPHPGKERDHG